MLVSRLAAVPVRRPGVLRCGRLTSTEVWDPRAHEEIVTCGGKFGWPKGSLPRDHGPGICVRPLQKIWPPTWRSLSKSPWNARPIAYRWCARSPRSTVDRRYRPTEFAIRSNGALFRQRVGRRMTRSDSIRCASSAETGPIIRFESAPDSVEVHAIGRPGKPFLGIGEAVQGPTAAAIANRLAQVSGIRIRDLPVTATRVRATLRV